MPDVPVQGDFFTGTDDHNFANSDFFNRQIDFNSISPYPGQFWGQVHELPDGAAGFLHRPAFQQFGNGIEKRDGGAFLVLADADRADHGHAHEDAHVKIQASQ